tara:strand:- start:1985 stop:3031 length:1047 start_codon:yes stop_codon:yes gene_type:complete
MLEQAIIDAKALKEAALKNAEQAVIDKYSTEIKAAVEELLEGKESQEVINEDMDVPYASDPSLSQDQPIEMEMEYEFNPEDFQIDLESIMKQEEVTEEETAQEPESLAADIGAEQPATEEPAADAGADAGGGLDALLQESNEDDEDEMLNELLALLETEEEEELLDESLVVDVDEVKHGHVVTDNSARKYDAQLAMAKQESSAYKEEAEELEKQVGELNNSILMYQDKQEKLKTVLDDMKGKLEEMILQNARLLYSNKVLRDASLNERQKTKIVEAIAKAETLKEAKTLYTTLKETTVGTPKERGPKSLSESVQRKQVLSAHLPRRKQENVSESHDFASRMKKLAGLD